jgi:hypothetical protein
MRIQTEFYEIFQNDVSLEKESLLETSQGNESLQIQLSIVPKND